MGGSASDFTDDVLGIDPNGGGIFDAAESLAGPASMIPGVGPIIAGGLGAIGGLGDTYASFNQAAGALGGNQGGGFADDVLGIDPNGGGVFSFIDSRGGQLAQSGVGAGLDFYNAQQQREQAERAAQLQAEGVEQGRQDVVGAGDNALARLDQSAQSQRDIIGNTYDQAGNLISPLAGQAQQFTDEQMALLGLNGAGAQQDAFSRVSDPLVAEQERAFMRNQSALGGGVGLSGNILSALAEQTRNRTNANVSQRLNQLQTSSSPALNALQQLSQQQLGRGQALTGIEGQAGANAANLLTGQGGQLAQLSQNLGTALAGGPAFRAQQVTPFTQGAQSFLSGVAGSTPPNQGQFVPPPLTQVR